MHVHSCCIALHVFLHFDVSGLLHSLPYVSSRTTCSVHVHPTPPLRPWEDYIMASPALGSHTHDAEKLTAALAKMTVGDDAWAKSATVKRGGCLSGRDSVKVSGACVRKASPSWVSGIQQTKNFNLTAATFDFTPPLGAPRYPPWARGRKRFIPTRYSNKTKAKKRSTPKAFLAQNQSVPSKQRQSRPPGRDNLLTLLTLPPEIRNLIFSLVIGTNSQHHAQLRRVFVRRDAGRSSTQIIRRFPIEPSVSAVNHQLREEVLSMVRPRTFVRPRSSYLTAAIVLRSEET